MWAKIWRPWSIPTTSLRRDFRVRIASIMPCRAPSGNPYIFLCKNIHGFLRRWRTYFRIHWLKSHRRGKLPSYQSHSFLMQCSPNLECPLTAIGIPRIICDSYRAAGVSSTFRWQTECLLVFDGLCARNRKNLVYSAPTRYKNFMQCAYYFKRHLFLQRR